MLQKLEEVKKEFDSGVGLVGSMPDMAQFKADFLGKKGKLNALMGGMRDLSVEEKKSFGARANEVKQEMTDAIDKRSQDIELEAINAKLAKNKLDISWTDKIKDLGQQAAGLHPLTQVTRELEDIFLSMGFDILDGPHIEDEYHNFEALNIPESHPARDMQDTFWFKDKKHLLRTHTSNIQIRGMEQKKPPFKFVGPGKVFRCETLDASHEAAFHQLEGMMVGKDIAVPHMIHFLRTLLSEIFKREIKVRLRPGFFPFVEPGFELDYECLLCGGKGCSVCKQVGWVEGLGCGMVHPNVLSGGGIDPNKWNGFAFGLGIDRLAMMRYHIDDVRHLHSGNLQFSEQFKTY
ncbi:MAG: phenylalanine--tRNA ligase subunit alpha [Spirochaetales bacterium]|nr:phenylalanine--tRNA ligase subunit alpha [Spirochaetales bacterium]